MSARQKWGAIAAALIVLYLGGNYGLRAFVIMPSFHALEEDEAQKDIARCVDAIQREAHHLERLASDWALWDDTYKFAQDGNEAYIQSNLVWESLCSASGLDLVYVCDLESNVIWGQTYDQEQGKAIGVGEFPRDALGKEHPLLQHRSERSTLTGLMLTDHGPMFVASLPILTTTGQGPSVGTFIMGRFLNEETLDTLKDQTRVDFSVRVVGRGNDAEGDASLTARLGPETYVLEEQDAETLLAHGLIHDSEGKPALLVRAEIPREIMARGKTAARFASIATLLTAIATVVVGVVTTTVVLNILRGGASTAQGRVWQARDIGAVALVGCAGLIVTVALFTVARGWEHEKFQSKFDKEAETRASLFQLKLDTYFSELNALKRFYEGSATVNSVEFHAFTDPVLLQHPDILAFEWIPEVSLAERETHMEARRKEGFTQYQIYEKTEDSANVPAAVRKAYYAVTYAAGSRRNGSTLGFDRGSDPVQKEAIERALASGRATATAGLLAADYPGEEAAFLVFVPVNRHGLGADFRGVALGAFSARAAFESAISVTDPAGIDVTLWDRSAPEGQQFLHKHVARTRSADRIQRDELHQGPSHATAVAVGGRRWELLCTPCSDYLARNQQWQSWAVLAAGLMFTGWLTMYALGNRRRTAHIAALVQVRTSELQASKERLRDMALSSSDWMWEADAEGKYTYVGGKVREVLGYEPEELIGRSPLDFVCEEEAESIGTRFLEISGERKPICDLENWNKHKDGHPICLLTNGVPILGGAGELLGYRGVDKDITERRRAEEELTLFRRFAEASGQGLGWTDLNGVIRYANPALCGMLGVDHCENACGHEVGDLCGAEAQKNLTEVIFPALLKTGRWTGEVEVRGLKGEVYQTLGSFFVIRDSKGAALYSASVFTDITERKRSEAELERVNRQLEEAIAHANDMTARAEAASTAKSAFLANMSHEIRTPMNGVVGMTGLLLDTDLDAEQRGFAETVRSSADALLAIINDILDFSKIEADKLTLESLDFDLRAALEETSDLLGFRAQEKGLEFICQIDQGVPTRLQGDPGRLRQIILNLTGNAIKFTSKGEVAIKTSLVEERDDAVTLRFDIRDTGVGIPENQQSKLFEAFTQADTTTTRKFGGTGLGLAISKRLSTMMKGQIGFESVEGEGSTFWFTSVFGKQSPNTEPVAPLLPEIANTRVLVTDDNVTNRRLMSALLEKWGCPHHEAPNSEDTLAALRAGYEKGQPYQIAILDMQMPGVDGEELGRRIKADASLRETLLVAMTSVGRRGDAVRLRREGFAAYLTKPVKQSLLHDCLATLLSPEKLRAAQTQGQIVTRHSVAEDKGRGVRILLAEDNPTNQKVALGILGKFGCRTDAVSNGLKAIQALESVPYDLVLMDCQMPELDGYEATRAIRSPESAALNHRIPIIAMTANAMQGDRDKCLAAGMDDYLAKPVRPDALGEMVKKWASAATPPLPHHEKALPSASAAPVIFDRGELVARMLGDEELAQTVVEGFLEDAPRLIEALWQALRAGDSVLVRREGHSIKGAAANVGAPALRDAAHEVEKAGAAGDLMRATSLMPHVEEQFLAFREIAVGEAMEPESESP